MRIHSSIPMLRIVPDDTKFDFMRFRRISFPISAVLSIVAIALYFFHGLNFGIDFIGGALVEGGAEAGAAGPAHKAQHPRRLRPWGRRLPPVRAPPRLA